MTLFVPPYHCKSSVLALFLCNELTANSIGRFFTCTFTIQSIMLMPHSLYQGQSVRDLMSKGQLNSITMMTNSK